VSGHTDKPEAPMGRLVRWLWWQARFYGYALSQREWEDPKVQALVRERGLS
jgi:hypothetical protein